MNNRRVPALSAGSRHLAAADHYDPAEGLHRAADHAVR
jgi:hypothetical protein